MLNFEQMIEAGVHFGHLKRKWNPKMAPYIFKEHNGIHIIDLQKTAEKAEEAAAALKQIAKSGKTILFVATKKQAKDIVANEVKRINMPYVTERWPGGMLTNFVTIRKAVKKMHTLDKLINDKNSTEISKRERLQISRERAKLEKTLGSIADLKMLPAAVFIVDINKEHIAVAEARRLNIPTFATVDTNCNPELINFPIPANDDASKAIALILKYMCDAIEEGLKERKMNKDAQRHEEEESEEIKSSNIELMDEEENSNNDDGETKVKKVKAIAEDEKKDRRPRKPMTKKPVNKISNNNKQNKKGE
ncbi:MAG: 30S ribosomal protein S2 [Bacteroidales bacterium]|jgi:small subunit ribosomal protein S2|nr:30S ribosomal protein S2 [Bacteroidales bacterium]